ncbi:phage tail protein [Modestobacter altitudinis]|uniref:phage tail protein n=1 Tax=Modestobacter altitudinis TaxID=2213158 RepID=UPI00110CA4CF|nr:phage tail protein [Modestobacter altitudinis]
MTAIPSSPSSDRAAVRRTAPVVGRDWDRCAHRGTVVDVRTAEVLLEPRPAAPPPPWPLPGGRETRPDHACAPGSAVELEPAPPVEPAGLGFDQRGCLFHGVPERGQVQRLPWPARGEPVDLLAGPPPVSVPAPGGVGFVPVGGDPRRPLRAWALAADRDEHLFVLDGAGGTVQVLDLADGHLVRTVGFASTPLDLAVDATGRRDASVLVLTASRARPLVRLTVLSAVVEQALPAGALAGVPAGARPARLAVAPDGTPWLLLRDGPDAWVVAVGSSRSPSPLHVPGGTDLEFDGDGRLVVAGPPGSGLLTWNVGGDAPVPAVPLLARGYDGRGLARTPDGRVGYWTGTAFRAAVAERVRYSSSGTVDTRPLDSRGHGQQWGRVFVEACVPPDTRLLLGAATDDELVDPPPAGLAQLLPLHRRETGRELAWSPLPPGDRYAVYEAPVAAPPGRYLWLRLQLTGPGCTTPRVRAVRAEFPGHGLVEKLPGAYRRDPVATGFLRRYLALLDGQLTDMESRSVRRDLLLDPWSAPPELLDWLASLVGLTLDARWTERARRTVLAEAGWLFHRRGTPGGLRRLLEIYLGAPVVVLEGFRLRAAGGRVGGGEGASEPTAVVGGGSRVGGAATAVDGPAEDRPADPFRAAAHRFSVLITREVADEELVVVRDLLDLERPAHTIVDICTVGSGMRVGIGLHLELSTIVGPGSGVRPLRVGRDGALGGDGVVGRGRAGIRAGGTRLGDATVVDT